MGKKGPLTIVSPDEFRVRTALSLSSRSGTTLAVDSAYKEYFELRSPDNAAALYRALNAYLVAHGGDWSRCDRDKVSGGLMKYLWEYTARYVTPTAPLTPDQRTAQRIQTQDIPHTRYGVLYLLSKIDLKMDYVNAAVEGVSYVGGAIGSGFALDTGKITQIESAKHAFTMSGTAVNAQQLTSAGSTLVRQAPTIARTVGAGATAIKTLIMAPGSATDWNKTLPATVGGLWKAAEKIPEIYQRSRFLGVVAGVGVGLATPVTLVADLLYNIYTRVKAALKALVDIVMERIRLGNFAAEMGGVAKAVTKVVLEMVVKNAAPFINSTIDVGTGLFKTIQAAKQRIEVFLDRKKFIVMPGHPEEIANSIEGAMSMGIFKGLWQMLSGVGKTAINAFLPGLGVLVNAVLTGIEWIVKMIYRILELKKVRAFLLKARELFEEAKKSAKAQQGETFKVPGHTETVRLRNVESGQLGAPIMLQFGKGGGTFTVPAPRNILEPDTSKGIIADTRKFTEFFRQGCEASPIIPMLTLNSGICGSLMTMAKMFTDSGEMITGRGKDPKAPMQSFDYAARYFERLKVFSSHYLAATGFTFIPRDPDDAFIKGLMKHALNHRSPPTVAGTALSFLAASG